MEKSPSRRIETTLGDLIAAASEVAFEYSDNDKEAYNLAQLAVGKRGPDSADDLYAAHRTDAITCCPLGSLVF